MDPIEIMLEEYKTLRQESLDAMKNRNTILSFGLAAIGALFTGSIVAYKTDIHLLITNVALIVMIPAVSYIVLAMWLGEYERSQRAGKFLVGLECRINTEASRTLLTWETRLRKKRSHMKYPYHAAVVLPIGISAASQVTGLITADFSAIQTWSAVVAAALIHLVLWLVVTSYISKLTS